MDGKNTDGRRGFRELGRLGRMRRASTIPRSCASTSRQMSDNHGGDDTDTALRSREPGIGLYARSTASSAGAVAQRIFRSGSVCSNAKSSVFRNHSDRPSNAYVEQSASASSRSNTELEGKLDMLHARRQAKRFGQNDSESREQLEDSNTSRHSLHYEGPTSFASVAGESSLDSQTAGSQTSEENCASFDGETIDQSVESHAVHSNAIHSRAVRGEPTFSISLFNDVPPPEIATGQLHKSSLLTLEEVPVSVREDDGISPSHVLCASGDQVEKARDREACIKRCVSVMNRVGRKVDKKISRLLGESRSLPTLSLPRRSKSFRGQATTTLCTTVKQSPIGRVFHSARVLAFSHKRLSLSDSISYYSISVSEEDNGDELRRSFSAPE